MGGTPEIGKVVVKWDLSEVPSGRATEMGECGAVALPKALAAAEVIKWFVVPLSTRKDFDGGVVLCVIKLELSKETLFNFKSKTLTEPRPPPRHLGPPPAALPCLPRYWQCSVMWLLFIPW